MRIPSEVNVLGTTFVVKVEPMTGDDCGETLAASRIIRIDSGLAPAVQVETFYHELMHAMLDHTGLCHLLTPQGQEAFCQGLGMALTYVLTANEMPTLKGDSE